VIDTMSVRCERISVAGLSGEPDVVFWRTVARPRQGWPDWLADDVREASMRAWTSPRFGERAYQDWLAVIYHTLLEEYWEGLGIDSKEDANHLRRWGTWLELPETGPMVRKVIATRKKYPEILAI
jgi:hypothetical protein